MWGTNSYNGGNYGNTTIGTAGYAGTGYTGNGEAIDIQNKAYNVVFYIVACNTI
jgi:hypothetical protein